MEITVNKQKDLIQFKSFWTAKETINKIKDNLLPGENIFKQRYQEGIDLQNRQTVHTA